MTVATFWTRADWLPRAALAVAALAGAVHLGTFGSLSVDGPGQTVFLAFHLTVMALMFAVFLRIARHHLLGLRSTNDTPPVELPRALVRAAVIVTIYGVALLVWLAVQFGEGGPQAVSDGYAWVTRGAVVRPITEAEYHHYSAVTLRVFSSWWIFFSLIAACVGYVYREKSKLTRTRSSAQTS